MQQTIFKDVSLEEKVESTPLKKSPAWLALEKHFLQQESVHMRSLFASDDSRAKRFSASAGDIFLDYSKNRLSDKTKSLLMQLARDRGVEGWRDRMFRGDAINSTEGRAVLHTALRNKSGRPVMVDGKDVMPQIQRELDKMRSFSDKVRSGDWKGYTDKRITDIVNIGIGGSDLGPAMACEALTAYKHPELNLHFVSNIDGSHITEALRGLDPQTTLFIVASKMFTTQETLRNAHAARDWFLKSGASRIDIARHFAQGPL